MLIGQIVSLCVITGAFTLFAVVLAWGDYQKRHVTPAARKAVPQAEPAAGLLALKNTKDRKAALSRAL
jgi:hypothetical protein